MRRVRVFVPATGGGGGGPGPGTATLAWGPSFGQSAGHDASSFDAQGAIDLDSIALVGALAAQGAIDLDSVDLNGALASQGAIDLNSVDLNGALAAQTTLSTFLDVTGMEAIEDTYLDENVPDTTHGASTSLLSKTNAAVGQNEQITYLAWDFTWLAGSVQVATIDLKMSTTAALGENANISVRTNATKPFEEDTATWNNTETPSGTQRQTISQAVTTTPTVYTLTLDATTRANMPGNWVFLRIPGTSALGVNTITTVSKESGTAGDRPQMDFEVTL